MGHRGREKRTKVAGKPKKNDKYRGETDRQAETDRNRDRETDRDIQADRQTGAEREREGEGQRVGRDGGGGGCRKGLIEEEGSKQ